LIKQKVNLCPLKSWFQAGWPKEWDNLTSYHTDISY